MKKTFTKLLLLSGLLCVLASAAIAQKVKGVVVSADDKLPIIGAAVKVLNGEASTITDANGNFTLKVDPGQSLVATFIGYEEATVEVGASNFVSITMKGKIKETGQVNIAYGKVARRELTGSVSTVSDKAFKNVPTPSFDQALQGRAPGLSVTSTSGVPGTASRVRIRGGGSISASGDPLYVIDGMIMSVGQNGTGDYSSRGGSPTEATNYSVLSNIDPNDIENISVLKDASATAIYGSRGANGVIIITTKSGKSGTPKYNFSYYVGATSPSRKLPMLNGSEWLSLQNELRVNQGKTPYGPNEVISTNGLSIKASDAAKNNTDWLNEVFRTGRVQEANLGVTGGNDYSSYALSTSYYENESFLKGGNFKRYAVRGNIDNKLTNFLNLSLNNNITYTDQTQIPTGFNVGGLGSAQSNAIPIFPVYNPDGTYFGTTRAQNFNTGTNPVAQRENQYKMDQLRSLNNLVMTLKFTDYLRFRSSVQSDILSQRESFYNSKVNRYAYKSGRSLPSVPDSSVIPLASLAQRTVFNINLMTTQQLVFEKTFAEKHKINATAFYEYQRNTQRDAGLYPSSGNVGFLDDRFSNLTSKMAWAPNADTIANQGASVTGYNSLQRYVYNSLGARLNYVYAGKYIAEVSTRQDGSSNFGPNNRFARFYAVSAGWIISDEAFWKSSILNYLKVRTSWGTSGNAGFDQSNWYASYGNALGYIGQQGLQLTRLYNPNVTWEKQSMFDFSIDYGFLNNRITGALSFYNKFQSDPLLYRPVQSSAYGYLGAVYVNDQNVKVNGYGVEFNVTSVNLQNQLRWTTDFNISSNQNKVTDIGPLGPDAISTSPGDTRFIVGSSTATNYISEFAGVDAATGKEMIYDLNGNKVIATAANVVANRKAMGSPNPKFFGGINNTFTYKNFDLSVFFTFSYGNTVYDDGAKFQIGGNLTSWNQRREILDRWQKPGDETNVTKLGEPWYNTSRWLYDASYLRLRTISIGYNIPASILTKMKMRSCRVYVSGQNLFVLTKFKGWDPEVTRNVQNPADGNTSYSAPYLATPQAVTIQAGFNLGF